MNKVAVLIITLMISTPVFGQEQKLVAETSGSSKTIQVRTGWITFLKAMSLTAAFPVSKNVSIGPTYYNYGQFEDSEFGMDASGIGLRTDYYFDGNIDRSSWFLGLTSHYKLEEDSTPSLELGDTNVELGFSAGYQVVHKAIAMRIGLGISPESPLLDLQFGVVF